MIFLKGGEKVMKLKNSHILLIVMAIFLLISIGSVCAQDTSAMDADVISNDASDMTISENGTDTTTVEKTATTVESQNTKVNEADTVKVPVSVKDNESAEINVTKADFNVSEGNKSISVDYNNSELIIKDKLSRGNHSLIIKYLGNDAYQNSSTNIILSIFGNYTLEAPSSVNVNSTKTVEIPVNVTDGVDKKELTADDFNILIQYKDGNNTVNATAGSIKLENGKLIFTYTLADNITTADATVTYKPDNLTSKVTLKRIFNAKIEVLNNQNPYQIGNFTFRLVDVDTNQTLSDKTIKLTTTGNIRAGFSAKTDDNGIATFKTKNLYKFDSDASGSVTNLDMKPLEVGTHSVELEDDNGEVVSTKVTTNLTITKAKIEITIDPFKEYYGTNKNVTIHVVETTTGEGVSGTILHLYMPQTSDKDYYIQTDSNGTGRIGVKGLVGGTYNLTVSNNDTKNVENAQDKGTITIVPVAVTVSTSSKTMYYDTGSTAKITVKNKSTGKAVSGVYVLVQLYTGSKHTDYIFQTNSKGVVEFSAPLGVGKHKMVVSTADTRYSGSSVTKYITVKKASAKLSAPKVTAYYKQGKTFTVKLTNTKNSKAIYGAKVNIRVFVSSTRYYNYVGQTGADGKLKLTIDLKPGTYKVQVLPGESKNYTAKKISSKIVVKKAPTKLTPKKLTAKKGASKYFKVTVKNTKTKKIIKGVKVKVKVYTGKSYKTYTIKTNSKGIAKLNVKSLKVGTHKVVVTSANKYCVAKSAKSSIKITK